jgi:tetracycline repressor-like protein
VSVVFLAGYFMCNTAVEFGDEAGDIIDCVKRNLDRLISAFSHALAHAKANGEVKSDLEPQWAAEFLVNIFIGAVVRIRAKSSIDGVEQSLKIALNCLG